MEHIDVAMSIAGSAVTCSEVRKSASRVALPPTNSAVTAAAQIIAVVIARDVLVILGAPTFPRRRLLAGVIGS